MAEMKMWFEFAKIQKNLWAKISPKGDLHPTIIVERGGQPIIAVVSPQINKESALKAASVCQLGMEIDAVSIITDGFTLDRNTVQPNKHQEIYDALNKEYGSLQDAFLAGRKEVVENLIAIRCDKNNELSMVTANYRIKDGKITWEDEFEIKDDCLGGNIPKALKSIMSRPPLAKLKIAAEALGLNEEQQQFHQERAVRRFLRDQEYLILDFVKLEKGLLDQLQKTDSVFWKQKTKPFMDQFRPSAN